MLSPEFDDELRDIINKAMAARMKKEYYLNMEQMRKLSNIIKFFKLKMESDGGCMDPIEIEPTDINGGITVYFNSLYLVDDDIKRFCDLLRETCALEFTAVSEDGFYISLTVPDIYVEKPEKKE